MKYVFIIDDSITIRSTIKIVIRDLGYGIVETENGKEALQRINEMTRAGDKIILCIVDVNMPVMGGISFTREFRKIDKFTPIIMLTTESQQDLIQEAMQLGASAWIIKPFQPKKLTEMVTRLIK